MATMGDENDDNNLFNHIFDLKMFNGLHELKKIDEQTGLILRPDDIGRARCLLHNGIQNDPMTFTLNIKA